MFGYIILDEADNAGTKNYIYIYIYIYIYLFIALFCFVGVVIAAQCTVTLLRSNVLPRI